MWTIAYKDDMLVIQDVLRYDNYQRVEQERQRDLNRLYTIVDEARTKMEEAVSALSSPEEMKTAVSEYFQITTQAYKSYDQAYRSIVIDSDGKTRSNLDETTFEPIPLQGGKDSIIGRLQVSYKEGSPTPSVWVSNPRKYTHSPSPMSAVRYQAKITNAQVRINIIKRNLESMKEDTEMNSEDAPKDEKKEEKRERLNASMHQQNIQIAKFTYLLDMMYGRTDVSEDSTITDAIAFIRAWPTQKPYDYYYKHEPRRKRHARKRGKANKGENNNQKDAKTPLNKAPNKAPNKASNKASKGN
eukprot:16344-Hanusia_phi.AAC.3